MAGLVIDDGIRPAHEWSPWSADNTDHLREQGTVCAKISIFALVATLLLMVRAYTCFMKHTAPSPSPFSRALSLALYLSLATSACVLPVADGIK